MKQRNSEQLGELLHGGLGFVVFQHCREILTVTQETSEQDLQKLPLILAVKKESEFTGKTALFLIVIPEL